MVQLRILAGRRGGQTCLVRRLPFVVGRGAAADYQLDDTGVWERHLQLELDPAQGLVLSILPGALGTLNGQPFQRAALHNGDLLELGGAKVQFWLSETQPMDFRWRERLTWVCLALLCLAQVALVYWLTGY